MRTLKGQLNIFGLARLGGSSAPERKRRKKNYAENEKDPGPTIRAKVVGFISPLPSWGS